MKTKLIWFSLGATSLLAIAVFACSPRLPPERSHVVGVWSGYSDHSDFLRLELDNDGTGFLSIGYVRDKATLYRVQAWKYSDRKVELTTKPIDADAEPVSFTNFVAGYQHAECEFGGDGGWKRKAKLICESEWKTRSTPLQERIAQYRKEKR